MSCMLGGTCISFPLLKCIKFILAYDFFAKWASRNIYVSSGGESNANMNWSPW